MSRPGRVLLVTGTSTGVGKTVVTAALSSVLATRGEQVVVVKPVQTGIADGDCDAEEVHRLTGCAVQEHAALDEPLAPAPAPAPAAFFALRDRRQRAGRLFAIVVFSIRFSPSRVERDEPRPARSNTVPSAISIPLSIQSVTARPMPGRRQRWARPAGSFSRTATPLSGPIRSPVHRMTAQLGESASTTWRTMAASRASSPDIGLGFMETAVLWADDDAGAPARTRT